MFPITKYFTFSYYLFLFFLNNSVPSALSSEIDPSDDPPNTRRRLDLPAACRCQLETAGLPVRSIFSHPPCTACHRDSFYSYRAEGGSTGRMLAAIGKIL